MLIAMNDPTLTRRRCVCSTFLQSRSLRTPSVSADWSAALFALLDKRPRDMIYSIAFLFAFVPTHDINSESMVAREAFFTASRELYDLVDDNVRETDTLSIAELVRDRVCSLSDFAEATDDYRRRSKSLVEFVHRYHHAFADDTDESVERLVLDPADREAMLAMFKRLNTEVATLPFVTNAAATRTVNKFDLDAIRAATDTMLLHGSYDELNPSRSREDSSAKISPSAANEDTDHETRLRPRRFDESWSAVHLYVRYAYALARYDSLRSISRALESQRDGLRLEQLVIPLGSAWQGGTSQLLWILLHTLAALTVSRRNLYLDRLLVILQNLSFFVWCGQCSHHWKTNGGSAYFELLNDSRGSALIETPIDITLLRCHNAISTRINPYRRLSAWSIAHLVTDYREFVERRLLSRRPNVCARDSCPGCNAASVDREKDDVDPPNCFLKPHYVLSAQDNLSQSDTSELARGESLLFRLGDYSASPLSA